MLPAFGAGLQASLSEPNVPATHSRIQERVAHALERWEPRITVQSVAVEASPTDPEQALVTISYSLVATRQPDRLVVGVQTAG
jgi:phage baseplate assembly protein W